MVFVSDAASVDTPLQAGLQEIFSSIQGEGIHVGRRQIFFRFNACHLQCVYCDTPQRPASRHCEVEPLSGSGEKVLLENPVSLALAYEWIERLHTEARHHSISFTGGEPLLYTRYLKELLPKVSALLPVYLETSGTQPEKLEEVLPWVTTIAMDIKLPSATGEPMQVENHRRFFELSRSKELFTKLVFAESTPESELDAVREIVSDPTLPMILQPMTDLNTGENTVSPEHIFRVERYLSPYFSDLRVIPQTHKMLSIL